MLKNLNLINPYSLENEDCPIFVQAGDMKGFLGWGIKIRTNSNWSHSMMMRISMFFASQSWTYKEIPIKKYMKPYIVLKFWRCKDITYEERYKILKNIEDDLRLPWWRKIYDFPGVFGQALGIKWINIPFLNYCSERVVSKVRILIPEIGKHPTPEDLDSAFKKNNRFEILGYWLHENL